VRRSPRPDITVFLIEAGDLTPGAELSSAVRAAMEQVAAIIRNEFGDEPDDTTVEVTPSGHLRVPAALAATHFPSDACGLVLAEEDGRTELLMVPLQGHANGGQLLKQRNLQGDRVLLVRETLADDLPMGNHRTRWDQERGALVVDLEPGEQHTHGRRVG
jgi:hydrogenase maturation protease